VHITKEFLQKTVLVVVSIIVALILSEGVYRSYVVFSYAKKTADSNFKAYLISDQREIYDQQYGYSYCPNKDISVLGIENNKATSWVQHTFNEFGVPEVDATDFKRAQEDKVPQGPRILVLGDSFTSVSYGGETWVSLFSKRLKEKLGPNAQVLNFGRDGYGVLQMLELAAGKIETWKPNIILFAFITDDLHRRKFWRKTVLKGESGYAYVIYDPADDEKSFDSRYIWFIDRRVTKKWCEKAMKNGGEDPLIATMTAAFKKMRNIDLNKEAPDFFVAQPFIFNRLICGQPVIRRSKFHGENLSFSKDSGLKTAIDKLNKSGIPYYFVHFPMLHEMERHVRWLPSPDDLRLTNELFAMTGHKTILFLGDYLHLSREQLGRFPICPQDLHPSKEGIRYYADAMINLYLNRDRVGIHKDLWTGEGKPAVFTAQIIKSPLFESSEGWGPGFSKATGHGPGVVVGPGADNPNVFAQQFLTKPGEQFKIVARASVAKTLRGILGFVKSNSMGRFQINWVDAENKFITTFIKSFEVTPETATYEAYVMAPENAMSGILYVVPDGPDDVVRYTEMRLLGEKKAL